jgi:NAD(P)-dependent dehydrogenase (short-subunit alcohol dehydrogenase family)
MQLSLSGKTVLVTGSTQGLGAAIAEEAAGQHAEKIAITGRDRKNGEEVAEKLSQCGAAVRFFEADLSDEKTQLRLVGDVLDWAGGIDGLVNCAGRTDRASFVDGTPDQWDALFSLNAQAPFFLMQAFIRHRLAAGGDGSIVNILSMNAHCGQPDLAIYSATKGALSTLTKNAANAHLSDGIRVNGINMGWAATDAEIDMQANVLGNGDGWLKKAEQKAPLGRLLTTSEVARLCVYLLSDYSGLQTGTLVDLEQQVVGAP